jgi:hypothetical protein
MDFEQAKQDVMTWVEHFVERPNANLNGWPPCPHARRARLDNQFDIRRGQVDPYTDLMHVEMSRWRVIAFVYDPDRIGAEEFGQQIAAVNTGFLIPRGMIGLADHPHEEENVRGVIMNQGQWALAFVQPLQELNHFARLIAGRGYYDGWPEEYLQDLFRGREDPRS